MSFANLDTDKGLVELNNFLVDKSYIAGYDLRVSRSGFDVLVQLSSFTSRPLGAQASWESP